MPTLALTNEQVMELVRQLPGEQQAELFKMLLIQQWGTWEALSSYGSERVRVAAAQRGRNWDNMSEDEREAFIDDLVHED